MNTLQENKKEGELYFNGCFWIVAESFLDIMNNNYEIIGNKFLVDIDGNKQEKTTIQNTHRDIWERDFQNKYNKSYTYYPRGRVTLFNKTCYININGDLMKNPDIMNKVYSYYELSPLTWATDIRIVCNNEQLGNEEHYSYQMPQIR